MSKKLIALTALSLIAFSPSAFAEGDVKKGEKVFKKCKACHMVGEKAKNKSGPELNNLFGRKAGGLESFKRYSKAFKAKNEEGLVWTEETLDVYLKKPRDFIPKSRMSFSGLKKDQDRADIIAYLKTFSPEE